MAPPLPCAVYRLKIHTKHFRRSPEVDFFTFLVSCFRVENDLIFANMALILRFNNSYLLRFALCQGRCISSTKCAIVNDDNSSSYVDVSHWCWTLHRTFRSCSSLMSIKCLGSQPFLLSFQVQTFFQVDNKYITEFCRPRPVFVP